MPTYGSLRLGLAVSLIVLVIGVTAAHFHITGAIEIISVSLFALTALIAAIGRNGKGPDDGPSGKE